jgi:hypothetical protein
MSTGRRPPIAVNGTVPPRRQVPMVAIVVSVSVARAAPIAASMAIASRGAIPPHRSRPQRQRRTAGPRLCCLARNAACGRGMRASDRGVADPRPGQPFRGRVEREPGQTTRRRATLGAPWQEATAAKRGKTCNCACTAALRRFSDVLLTLLPLLPLLLAGVVTLEVCVVMGLQLNFANIIALPLLLGIGVAFKIYYIMAWRADQTGLLQSSLTRAVIFSAMTTATAFFSLWLSSHPGTSSMGKC